MLIRKPLTLVGVVLLAGAASTGAVQALETAERTVSLEVAAPEGSSLQVENLLGSVEIKRGRQDTVARITARVVAEAKTREEADALAKSVDLSQRDSGNGTLVRVGFPLDGVEALRPPKAGVKGLMTRWTGALFQRGSVEVEYDGRTVPIRKDRKATGLAVHLTVSVPVDYRTTASLGAGSIRAKFIRGDLDLRTVQGSIEVVSCFGGLSIAAEDGDVMVASYQGRSLDVTTAAGNVDLQALRLDRIGLRSDGGVIRGTRVVVDELEVRGGTGKVEFSDLVPRTAEVRTGSGDVDLAMRLKSARSAVVETDSGNVLLRVGEHINFGLRAETKSGSVKTVGMDLEVVERDGRASHLQHGTGGIDLEVSAAGGNLTVCSYDTTKLQALTGKKFD